MEGLVKYSGNRRHKWPEGAFFLRIGSRQVQTLGRAINQYIKKKSKKDHKNNGDKQLFEEDHLIVGNHFSDCSFHLKI